MKWITNILLLLFLQLDCQAAESGNLAAWSDEMQQVAESVGALVPYVYSHKEFHNPENFSAILARLEHFARSVHKVSAENVEKMLGPDPLAIYIINDLQNDADAAVKVFNSGHFEYARTLVRNSVNHCFRCHTRTDLGPEYSQWRLDFSKVNLKPTEKADLMVATRQYDRALEILSEVIGDKIKFYDNSHQQEGAIKRYLAIQVRIKKNPEKALQTLNQFVARGNLPIYLIDNARQWKTSLEQWVRETENDNANLEAAKKLVSRAKKIQQYDADEAAVVEYLRASTVLHSVLGNVKPGAERSEVYLLLGNSYNAMANMGYWNVPELYFEACIRELPGSNLAKQCFKEYEKNLVLGFSGSAGILIPATEKVKLKALKGLAEKPE